MSVFSFLEKTNSYYESAISFSKLLIFYVSDFLSLSNYYLRTIIYSSVCLWSLEMIWWLWNELDNSFNLLFSFLSNSISLLSIVSFAFNIFFSLSRSFIFFNNLYFSSSISFLLLINSISVYSNLVVSFLFSTIYVYSVF